MTAEGQGRIRVGIGGWTYEPWRGSFYPAELPQKRELEYASHLLTTIEVNGTYYRTQTPDSFARWHDETPEDFVLSLKAPRFATNRKILREAGESIQRFLDSGLERLGHKLGPINWQFMATKKFDPEDFQGFLQLLPPDLGGLPLRHAVEVRHESFRTPEFIDMARNRGVAIVLSADGEFPQFADQTADFTYARIMGTEPEHAAGYAPDALDLWTGRAQVWAAGGLPEGLEYVAAPAAQGPARDVFLYVISGHKVSNPTAATEILRRLNRDP